MTKEQLAEMLNGREYCEEITATEEKQAKENGLVVVFGASDDLIEFRGAIHDEGGGKGDYYIHNNELMDSRSEGNCKGCPYRVETIKKAYKITSIWGDGEYSWTYKADIPHATFDIMEDGEKYCRGMVFSIEDVKK